MKYSPELRRAQSSGFFIAEATNALSGQEMSSSAIVREPWAVAGVPATRGTQATRSGERSPVITTLASSSCEARYEHARPRNFEKSSVGAIPILPACQYLERSSGGSSRKRID